MPGAHGAPPTPRMHVAAATTGEEPDFYTNPTATGYAGRGPGAHVKGQRGERTPTRLSEEVGDMKDGT